jgi:hypothetical protein
MASAIEPVNIAIANKYFLQYNVAEGFNVGTQEMQNQVTIVETIDMGTNLLAGLRSGSEWKISNFMGSTQTLIIRACQTETGATGSKIMVMSVALDKSICSSYTGDSILPTPFVEEETTNLFSSCFSGQNTVDVLDRGLISMDRLRIGDFVRTSNGDFSQVYSFGHLDRDMKAAYFKYFPRILMCHWKYLLITWCLFLERLSVPLKSKWETCSGKMSSKISKRFNVEVCMHQQRLRVILW